MTLRRLVARLYVRYLRPHVLTDIVMTDLMNRRPHEQVLYVVHMTPAQMTRAERVATQAERMN